MPPQRIVQPTSKARASCPRRTSAAIVSGALITRIGRYRIYPILGLAIATATLAVFFPVAAIGLWMLSSWGPVIWFICAATETVMHAGFPDLFGARWPIVAAHAAVAVIYILFRVAIHRRRRMQRR